MKNTDWPPRIGFFSVLFGARRYWRQMLPAL
jgi:hypothetical protein